MLFVFDRWLDDSRPWIVDEFTCSCGRYLLLVHRSDRYAVCPFCVITDRAVRV